MNLKTAKWLRKKAEYKASTMPAVYRQHQQHAQIMVDPMCPRGKYRYFKKLWGALET